MHRRTAEYAKQHGLFEAGSTVVAGVSGGADSVALLYILKSLESDLSIRVCAAHFNHRIRGESADRDENFVRELCKRLAVPLLCGGADVPQAAREEGKTLEQAARDLRYTFLEEARQHFGADSVAVAHHMDDQAETVLMHLVRGAGLTGLCGMQPKRDRIVRPLLFARRDEIEAYLAQRSIPCRTDETNLQREGARNRIRLDVMPYLSAHLNENAAENIARAALLLAEDEGYLAQEAQRALLAAKRDENAYDRQALLALAPPIRSRSLRIALALAGAEKDVEKKHIEAVTSLLAAETGASLDLPAVRAETEYARIRFVPACTEKTAAAYETPLNLCGETRTPLGSFFAEETDPKEFAPDGFTANFDRDKLPGGLTVRTRRPGDRFFPLNGPGRRKLKEYLIDKKVPRRERDVPLIAAGEEVLFLPGFTAAETVKVDGETKRILRVRYIPNEQNRSANMRSYIHIINQGE